MKCLQHSATSSPIIPQRWGTIARSNGHLFCSMFHLHAVLSIIILKSTDTFRKICIVTFRRFTASTGQGIVVRTSLVASSLELCLTAQKKTSNQLVLFIPFIWHLQVEDLWPAFGMLLAAKETLSLTGAVSGTISSSRRQGAELQRTMPETGMARTLKVVLARSK